MDLDNPRMEWAYVGLVIISWTWALSQWRMAFKKGGSWRWSTALWLTAKANFFTVAASVWWFNWTTGGPWLERAIYTLVIAQAIVFVHWLRLDNRGEAFLETNGEGQNERDERQGVREIGQDAREGEQNEREEFQNDREQGIL